MFSLKNMKKFPNEIVKLYKNDDVINYKNRSIKLPYEIKNMINRDIIYKYNRFSDNIISLQNILRNAIYLHNDKKSIVSNQYNYKMVCEIYHLFSNYIYYEKNVEKIFNNVKNRLIKENILLEQKEDISSEYYHVKKDIPPIKKESPLNWTNVKKILSESKSSTQWSDIVKKTSTSNKDIYKPPTLNKDIYKPSTSNKDIYKPPTLNKDIYKPSTSNKDIYKPPTLNRSVKSDNKKIKMDDDTIFPKLNDNNTIIENSFWKKNSNIKNIDSKVHVIGVHTNQLKKKKEKIKKNNSDEEDIISISSDYSDFDENEFNEIYNEDYFDIHNEEFN